MIKSLSYLALVMFLMTSCMTSEKSELPKNVKTAFGMKFPNAHSLEWTKVHNGLWNAAFELNDKAYQADFVVRGDAVEVDLKLSEDDLPKMIHAVLDKQFPDYHMEDVQKIDQGTDSWYQIEIEKGSEDLDVSIDLEGHIRSKKEHQKG